MKTNPLWGPGSVPWLLRHDLRLGGRHMRASRRRAGPVALYVLATVVVLLHVAGFAAAPALAWLHGQFRTQSLMAGSIALASVLALFMSKAISSAADTLFERGDLDLLLSSPLPMHRVLATRLLAIAVSTAIMPIVIVLPVVDGMVLRGYFDWIGAYPVILGLGMTASALGSALTFGLLRLTGARWTAVAARVLATLLGVVALVTAQVQFLLPGIDRSALWQRLSAQAASGAHGPIWWPARALLGEPLPMLVFMATGMAILWGVSTLLGRAYAYGVLGPAASPQGTGADGGAAVAFGSSSAQGALLRKEFLLMVRQPGFAANILYQLVFIGPGTIMARRLGEASGTDAHAGIVLLTVMMTGRIARIVTAGPFSGDDAAGLAASSPASARSIVLAKLAASASLLAAVVAASLLVVWVEMPRALPATAVAATAAAGARLWMAAGQEQSLRRTGMGGRFQGDATALPGFLADLCWGLGGVALALAF